MGVDVNLGSGATGIVLGYLLKFGADLLTRRNQDRRQDQVWRRERLTDTAARLLTACVDATKANASVVRYAEELGTAENRGASDISGYRDRWSEATEASYLAAVEVDRAVQAVLLYGATETREAALTLVTITKENPTMHEVIAGPFHNSAAAEDFRKVVQSEVNVQETARPGWRSRENTAK